MSTTVQAQAAFQAADEAWGAELERAFGTNACNARYLEAGMGDEGTTLRRLHDARQAACHAYTAAVTEEGRALAAARLRKVLGDIIALGNAALLAGDARRAERLSRDAMEQFCVSAPDDLFAQLVALRDATWNAAAAR